MSRYIDAESLENRIKAEWAKREDDKGYGLAQFFVKTQPTADVAPIVHGHWVRKPYFPDGTPAWVCSRCGRAEEEREPCCNCGAKMDEEVKKDGTV